MELYRRRDSERPRYIRDPQAERNAALGAAVRASVEKGDPFLATSRIIVDALEAEGE